MTWLRMRARRLLPALALLGCTAGSGADVPAKACSTIELEQLAMQLRHADPHEQARIVSEKLEPLCEWTWLIAYGDHDPGLTEDGRAVFARVCPREPAIVDREALTPEQLYDRCDFGRLQIVEREEYRLHADSDPFGWLLYQWLIENGASAEQARVIARAQLRTRLDPWTRIPGLRLPAIEAEQRLWGAPVVQVSASEVSFAGKSIMTLDAGVIADDPSASPVILPLYEALELDAEPAKQIAEASGSTWSGELMIAADPNTPFPTFERVAYTAERLGYTRLGLIVEPRLFDYRVLPLGLAANGDPTTLDVTVYPDRSRVRINPAHPPDFERSPAACDRAAPPRVIVRGTPDIDYARLLAVLVSYAACDELSLKLSAVLAAGE
jgi:hypothetical protein